jgi:hypothetical protein
MSIQIINLNKLLRLCALPENELIAELRDDLRNERNKKLGLDSGGGHFHHPWWTVAKLHLVGKADLRAHLPLFVQANRYRKRLYPLLTEAFLRWADELRRSTNESIGPVEERVHNHYPVPGLELTVKVDNLLGLQIGENHHRLIYPYFSEEPALSEQWARVGLWLMQNALSGFQIAQMEILDVLRSHSFSGASLALRGNEEAVFKAKYRKMLELWTDLRPEYGLAA